jgi:hypothetical protein
MSVTTMPRSAARPEAPSAPEAAERALRAAQRVFDDRIRLARLEARSRVRRWSAGALLLTFGGGLLLAAWVAGAIALALALDRWLALDASVGCVALLHALFGLGLFAAGRRRRAAGAAGLS